LAHFYYYTRKAFSCPYYFLKLFEEFFGYFTDILNEKSKHLKIKMIFNFKTKNKLKWQCEFLSNKLAIQYYLR